MGRTGACGDDAPMESFFALLQKNVLNRNRWQTRDELRLAITTWIERTYHRRSDGNAGSANSPPSNLKCCSPRSHKRPEPPTGRVNRTRGSPEHLVSCGGVWKTPNPRGGITTPLFRVRKSTIQP
jgi:hypothetical protein